MIAELPARRFPRSRPAGPCADVPGPNEPHLHHRLIRLVQQTGDPTIATRILAQTEISFSNSLIEAWWRVLEHNWLFLNCLDSEVRVRHLVEFYVAGHNQRLPHAAFKGQTPDEMYFGTGDAVPDQLAAARAQARRTRLEENRARHCALCD